MIRRAMLLLAAMMSLGLAACGKKGSPTPAGPGNEITYPHSYPAS